jgi:hypothetical protein
MTEFAAYQHDCVSTIGGIEMSEGFYPEIEQIAERTMPAETRFKFDATHLESVLSAEIERRRWDEQVTFGMRTVCLEVNEDESSATVIYRDAKPKADQP